MDDDVKELFKFAVAGTILLTGLGFGISYLSRNYERVDQAVQYDNAQNSDWKRSEFIQKANTAEATLDTFKQQQASIRSLVLETKDTREGSSPELKLKVDEANTTGQKLQRLLGELKTQRSEWMRSKVAVPVEVEQAITKIDHYYADTIKG